MKRLFILIFVFAFIGIRAQIAVEQFNQKSYATNYYRPFTGIVDLNLHVPTTRSQAVIAGLHHYSFFYIYDRLNDDNFFNTYGSDRYREWVMGNTLAADYRFYFNPRQGRQVKRIGYLTYINRLAIVQWRETTDLVENSWYIDQPEPGDPGYDPEWDDGFLPPRWLPNSYDNLTPVTTTAYRFGLEYGRRSLSLNGVGYRELGLAVVLNPFGQMWYLAIPMVNYRVGF